MSTNIQYKYNLYVQKIKKNIVSKNLEVIESVDITNLSDFEKVWERLTEKGDDQNLNYLSTELVNNIVHEFTKFQEIINKKRITIPIVKSSETTSDKEKTRSFKDYVKEVVEERGSFYHCFTSTFFEDDSEKHKILNFLIKIKIEREDTSNEDV
jgi:hypothetical protein